MYLTSITQRDRLYEVATRWLADRVAPGDGRFVTEVFIYEGLIAAPTVRRFLRDIHLTLHPGPIQLRRLDCKDGLRQLIVSACPTPSPRIRELFDLYRARPEEFFPRTPVDLLVAMGADGSLVGMFRVKRTQRVAEKVSRRVADRLAGRIQSAARSLAEIRAMAAGVPLEYLFSSPEIMAEEFASAERIVSQAFREPPIGFQPSDMRVDDVIGLKIVGGHDELARLEAAIRQHPGASLIEREEHRGAYNATNLLVDLELPAPDDLIDRLRGLDWSMAEGRGLSRDELLRDLPGYVETGARTIRAEVILTTFDELVESEFGRAIHEARILAQRTSVTYAGRIAKNASYIIGYLLMLAISPTVEVPELPVKMWGRYLPDTYNLAVWKLFGWREEAQMLDSFLPPPDDNLYANSCPLPGPTA